MFSFQNYVSALDVESKSSTGCQPLSDTDNAGVQQPSLSAVPSCTPSSVDIPYAFQQGSPARVQFSSLENHLAWSHTEKRLVGSPNGAGKVGNHDDKNHEVNADKLQLHACVDTVVCSNGFTACLLYTSPSPRDFCRSRMPSSA